MERWFDGEMLQVSWGFSGWAEIELLQPYVRKLLVLILTSKKSAQINLFVATPKLQKL